MITLRRFKRLKISGFTLIELLVVIAIIGLLSTIIASPVQTARKKARDAKKISELKGVQTAVEQYAENNGGNYPLTLWQLYPLYLPAYSQYASATDARVNNRDKFAYTTLTLTPVTPGGAKQIAGYHLGVHLESYNTSLMTDGDTYGTSTLASPVATSSWRYDNTIYTSKIDNLNASTTALTSYISGGLGAQYTITQDFTGTDVGTNTCSTVISCVFDRSNTQ